MMETFCSSLRTLFPECHSEYLGGSIFKRMDDWCNSVCSLGGDCPQSHCACSETAQPSTTSFETTLPTTTTSSTTTAPKTTASTTNVSSTQTTAPNVPSNSTHNLPSTKNIPSTNYTANFSVVCDHSTKLDQNVLANRYCPLAGKHGPQTAEYQQNRSL
ncbi:hypothetical protein DPMN_119695 [Dreissena polymorpha]|uniref:Uncharacterized protein n=1 Tax=Dreissena polymorpha TaxID=45954 RepID=A0A9D4GMD1_DREPO|nr:hypothetical protein DPMN_119695 [Dreissena polymorpha]